MRPSAWNQWVTTMGEPCIPVSTLREKLVPIIAALREEDESSETVAKQADLLEQLLEEWSQL